jgi:transcription elongation factor Elf1
MWLSRIEPDKPDHDRRIFECAECNNEKIVVVKYR